MCKPVYLESLGHIACVAGARVSEIQRIIDEIGAKPLFVINAVSHYPAEVCSTVVARVRGWTDQPAYHRRFDAEVYGRE